VAVRELFFVPLGNAHWEGSEVSKHHRKLLAEQHPAQQAASS
jgi:hypothetical protein